MRYTRRRRTHSYASTPRQTITSSTGSGQNYVRTSQTTGGESESETGYSTFSASPPHVALTSTPGLVVLLSSLLLVMSAWNGFFKEYWNALLNARTPQPQIDYHMILGGIVFIVILGVGAASSPELAGVELLMLLALWLLFIMFNGQNSIKNFFGWFGGNQSGGQQPPPNAAPGSNSGTVAQTGKLPAGGPH